MILLILNFTTIPNVHAWQVLKVIFWKPSRKTRKYFNSLLKKGFCLRGRFPSLPCDTIFNIIRQ